MSEAWAERERRTNRLVRTAADYVFRYKAVSPNQLYGLCKLTWITRNFDDQDAAYIRSTKIPALAEVFTKNYSKASLGAVAADIAKTLGNESAGELVRNHSGFTNFYGPYRNSARKWVASHFSSLLPLFKAAYSQKTDDDGLELIKSIAKLPHIPRRGAKGRLMRPEYLLTPAFFALDPRLRFPLINGNEGVQALLKKLNVQKGSLQAQYESMLTVYEVEGINDAADLDQVGSHLPDFVSAPGKQPTKTLLAKKATGGEHEVPLKDERDIERLQQALTSTSRRLHNKLTNRLRELLSDYTLLEGSRADAMFDVLVNGYDGTHNLLIEAKSSIEAVHIRMAVGQLFDYWYRLNGATDPHLAVLLPEKPDDGVLHMLDWLNIGVLWLAGDRLETCSKWLDRLAGD